LNVLLLFEQFKNEVLVIRKSALMRIALISAFGLCYFPRSERKEKGRSSAAAGKLGHSFAREFARVILDRVRGNLDQAPGSRNWGSELDAGAEFNFFYPPSAGRGRS
jgi:hypothetical protein